MSDMDKMVEKISNLLDLANNNPNEHEAMAAALKAQELMAKYHIELADLNHNSGTKIIEEYCKVEGSGPSKWRSLLAGIIAENFCCKVYMSETMFSKYVVFYGYENDAKIAKEVYTFLYDIGVKLARHQYYLAKREGRYTKYVMNTYLTGFCEGIREVLGKQCTALMVVVPEEVKTAFAEKTKDFKTTVSRITTSTNSGLYEAGVRDGKDTIKSRSIEKAS